MAIDLIVAGDSAYLASDRPLPADPVAVRYFSGPRLLEIDYGAGTPAQLLDREVAEAFAGILAAADSIVLMVFDKGNPDALLEGWDVPLQHG